MSQITDTLEPCPFCRRPVQTIRTNMDTSLQFVTCDKCQADGPVASTSDEAVALWNRCALAAQAVAVKPEPLPKDTLRFKRLSDADDGDYNAGLKGARDMAALQLASLTSVSIPGSSQPEPQDGWRPIETAPKDGRDIILGGCKIGPSVRVAHWGAGAYNRKTKSYDLDWTSVTAFGFGPTHWQPLPAAPKPEATE